MSWLIFQFVIFFPPMRCKLSKDFFLFVIVYFFHHLLGMHCVFFSFTYHLAQVFKYTVVSFSPPLLRISIKHCDIFGICSGMASWRKTAHLLRQGISLCSLWREQLEDVATANIDPAWETVPSSMSSEDEREETSRAVPSESALVGEAEEELLSMMTDLLAAQNRREEYLL